MTGLMARPNQDAVPKDDIPWYLKIAARVLGILAGFCKLIYIQYFVKFPPNIIKTKFCCCDTAANIY